MQNVETVRCDSKVKIARELEARIHAGKRIVSFEVFEVESEKGDTSYDAIIVTQKATKPILKV